MARQPLARQTAATSIRNNSGLLQGPAAPSTGRMEVRQTDRTREVDCWYHEGGRRTRGTEEVPMFDIRRREFITILGGAAVVGPFPARAQLSGRTYRIGFLGVFSYTAEYRRQVDALRTGLRQLGYEEGKNIVIHYRWAEGNYDRLPRARSRAGEARRQCARYP